ncbi:MAG: Ig-like domain-containing protein [Mycobacterium sp.]
MWVARNGARVGAAAFALGLSLAGPVVGIAAADGTDVATPATSDTQSQTPTQAGPKAPATRQRRAVAPAETQAGPARAARSAGATSAPRTATKPAAARRGNRSATTASAVAPNTNATAGTASQPTVPTTATPSADTGQPTVASSPSTQPTIEAPQQVAAKPIAALRITGAAATAAATDPISALFGPIQAFVEGIGLLIRRSFFNQAPVVAPVQVTGKDGGPITGTVGAVDPEGDPIIYSITDLPAHGTVDIGTDGNYVYTPGADFTGRDSFMVSATDTGFHINLLDLFRPTSTAAFLGVAQNVTPSLLTFTFNYINGRGGELWTQAARGSLEWAAQDLVDYFVVTDPVNVTFDVTAEWAPLSGTLASSGSDLTSSDPGLYDTVVQQKILTGVDANGAAADGTIDWNFGQPWAFGNTVVSGQYDFTSTAMHELLHALGFLSNVDEPGWDASNFTWTTFDTYMVTANGTPVIGNDYRWNPVYNTNLTGGNGGLYFGGPNAVAVYGGPVPLYTPDPWEPGSSVSHLGDATFFGRNNKLMNAISDAGLGVRVVSPIELAILQDIGYTVNTSASAFLILGFGLVRRRRRTS